MTDNARHLRSGLPLWLRTRRQRTRRYPPLRGPHEASLAIVGGGMTGALVAHAFASTGISTVLVEAEDVGRGSTAASSALLLQEPDRELGDLQRRYGRAAARRIWQLSGESVAGLVALLTRLGVPCDLERRDALYCAFPAKSARTLRREQARRARAGFPGTWLGPSEVRRVTGLNASGAIRAHGGASFDPYRACIGLMRSAADVGARVFERSPVTRIDAGRGGVIVRTRAGVVHAERVVIATGYATSTFRPLAGRFRMYRTYALATEPVGAAERRDLGLSDVMFWDTERPYHYARWTHDGRLILGGGDRIVRPGVRRDRAFSEAVTALRARFDGWLPALSSIPTAYAWEGLFAMTSDSLPCIGPHRRYPGHWFALGYGGNGMTFAYLAARLLLERWQGRVSRDHSLFEFGRVRAH